MTSIEAGGFAPFKASDRNFFLLLLASIWGAVVAGFTPDVFDHISGQHVPYAAIVHVHAAVFVGWLTLLTVQIALIRTGRSDLHKKMGLLGVAMVLVMAVIGPATSIVMGHREFGTPDGDPAFIILPFMSMVSFTVIALGGLALRKTPAAHKRLMLLATVFISSAGFARWLGGSIHAVMGSGLWPFFVQSFFGPILLVAAMAVYDLVTRRRLHPAFVIAALFGIANEVVVTVVYNTPAWTPIATRLIGR